MQGRDIHMSSNEIDFFYCKNKAVSDFMKTKNIRHVTVARDIKTNKIFSLFVIDDRFKAAMEEYKQLNK
jgi:hypothetical protein